MTDKQYTHAPGLMNYLQSLKRRPQQMADILLERRRTFLKISQDLWINAEGMTAQRKQATDLAQQKLDMLAQEIQLDKEGLEDGCKKLLGETLTPEKQLAREMRAARLWERFRDVLGSGYMQAVDLIEREKGDLDSLRVLEEELPDWLLTRNEHDATKDLLAFIDRYKRPLLTPPQRDARDILDELATGHKRLVLGLALATEELKGGMMATVLPTWESRDQVINVQDDTPATGKWANQ